MNFKKLISLFSLLMISGLFFAQNNSYSDLELFEFLGKVTTQGEKAKDVTIKAFDDDSCFSKYKTRSNGKFAFYGEGKKYFILQFKKPGFNTKQLLVITDQIKYPKDEIKAYRFDVNLPRTKKGETDDQFIAEIDVIKIRGEALKSLPIRVIREWKIFWEKMIKWQ